MRHATITALRTPAEMKRRSLNLEIDPIEGVVPVSRAAATLSELVRSVRTRRQPILVTHQGYGAAVLIDAETFKELKDLAERALEAEPEQENEV